MGKSVYEKIDELFRPRSMAAVGVSEKMGNMGMSFLEGYRRLGFKGPLYAIHPSRDIAGYDTYRSLMDVPGPVDMVKVSVPAAAVPDVIDDCANKGVKSAVIFASGFRESGEPNGAALEDKVVSAARAGGVRLIGPNCMGIHCPESGMTIRGDMPVTEPGNIGLIAQSGGIAISTVMGLCERGLSTSKVVSYGNESDLGPPEFLHYLARDESTRVICLYIEGARRPEELKAALRDAAARKPLVVLKGGSTGAGHRAVSSHTGAMAGASEVWEAMIAQYGGMTVQDLDEMLDLAELFSLSGPPKGRRVCLLTISGGFGVFGTDQVVRAGFEMPELRHETRRDLARHFDAPGTSIRNPVDLAAQFFQPQHYGNLFHSLDNDPGVDCFVLVLAMEYLTWINEQAPEISTYMVKALAKAMKKMNKPCYIAFLETIMRDLRKTQENYLVSEGFPVYPDLGRCLLALGRSLGANAGNRQ